MAFLAASFVFVWRAATSSFTFFMFFYTSLSLISPMIVSNFFINAFFFSFSFSESHLSSEIGEKLLSLLIPVETNWLIFWSSNGVYWTSLSNSSEALLTTSSTFLWWPWLSTKIGCPWFIDSSRESAWLYLASESFSTLKLLFLIVSFFLFDGEIC